MQKISLISKVDFKSPKMISTRYKNKTYIKVTVITAALPAAPTFFSKSISNFKSFVTIFLLKIIENDKLVARQLFLHTWLSLGIGLPVSGFRLLTSVDRDILL